MKLSYALMGSLIFAALMFQGCVEDQVQNCRYTDGNITMCFDTTKDDNQVDEVEKLCIEKSGDFDNTVACDPDGINGGCKDVALGRVDGEQLGSTFYYFYSPTPVTDAENYCGATLGGNYLPENQL